MERGVAHAGPCPERSVTRCQARDTHRGRLPEGYFEAFVTLCRDYADIQSKLAFISDARSTIIPTVLRLCAF